MFFSQSPKAARPQSFNYAPPVVEKRRPVETSPAPQYYDYEEEAPVTQRPVQLARPKYAVPAPPRQPQFVNNPQEFANSFDFSYTPEQRQEKPQAQYQYDSRQPVQFPPESEASPAPAVAGRSEQFTLFSPASRADTYKPKVRSRKIRKRHIKRRKKGNFFFIVKKKRHFYV